MKNDNIQNITFEKQWNKVYKDFSSLEINIISSLSTHEKEFIEMITFLKKVKKIFNILKFNLLKFKDKLSGINNDMKIQIKSSEKHFWRIIIYIIKWWFCK